MFRSIQFLEFVSRTISIKFQEIVKNREDVVGVPALGQEQLHHHLLQGLDFFHFRNVPFGCFSRQQDYKY